MLGDKNRFDLRWNLSQNKDVAALRFFGLRPFYLLAINPKFNQKKLEHNAQLYATPLDGNSEIPKQGISSS